MFERFLKPKPGAAEVAERNDAVLQRVRDELGVPADTQRVEVVVPDGADENLHPQPTEAEQQQHFDRGKYPHGFTPVE